MSRGMLRRWLNRLLTPGVGQSRPRRPSFRPTVEILEDRLTPSVTFASQATFAVGAEPSALATADFNGDNKPDIVSVSVYSNTLAVLLNTTPAGATAPSFAAAATFATGVQPTSVAVGDFNGDGKMDIAVTNYNGSSSVWVYLNTTPTGATVPSFSAPTTFAVSGQPVSLVAGDFNGDHKTDLALADNFMGNTLSVMLNQTPTGASVPSFTSPVTFAAGNGPEALVIGDFNGDNLPDIAAVNNGDGTVAVLLDTTPTGATTPSFSAPATFTVGNPIAIAAGDFNGDGKPDLVTVNNGDGTVAVLLDTTPTARPRPRSRPSRPSPPEGSHAPRRSATSTATASPTLSRRSTVPRCPCC